jgi:hypothetical protein
VAVAISEVSRESLGSCIGVFATITGDASFANEGEPIAPGDFGLGTIIDVLPLGPVAKNDEETSYTWAYDRGAGTMVAYESGAADAPFNEADTDDLSTYSGRVLVFGKP